MKRVSQRRVRPPWNSGTLHTHAWAQMRKATKGPERAVQPQIPGKRQDKDECAGRGYEAEIPQLSSSSHVLRGKERPRGGDVVAVPRTGCGQTHVNVCADL